MLSLAWKKLLVVAAFAGASIMLSVDVASAGWGSSGGSWGSSGGSWGSSGGSWGSSGGSWGSSGGSWGSSGGSSGGYVVVGRSWGSHGSSGGHWRPFRRWHHHRSYYSSGSSGGSWGSHGSSGGSYGSHGSSGGVYYSEPVEQESTPPAIPPAPVDPQASAARNGSVTIAINVPAEAKVFINGAATNSTGEERIYVSKGLAPGKRYRYTVRAEVERDGKTVVQEESVVLTSGNRTDLALNFDSSAENVAEKTDVKDENPRTTLKVEVPADAKVSVLGVETNQSGEVRYFHTDRLANGQKWDGYTIKAVVIRDGRPIELEKQVTLQGGTTQELAFDFAAAELAGRVSQTTR